MARFPAFRLEPDEAGVPVYPELVLVTARGLVRLVRRPRGDSHRRSQP